MKLIWRATARESLREITTYIADRNVAAATNLGDHIERCTRRLTKHPQLYRKGRVAGTREAVVHPNYVLVYRVVEDTIEIVNVMHSRRRYPSLDG